MDYYSILGINKNASDEDIRKAYKKKSMKHHPDRGGDEAEFKKVNEAYSTLKDPQKRAMYDNPQRHYNSSNFAGGQNPFEDVFGDMFQNFGFARQAPNRNPPIHAEVQIELEDVLFGKTIDAQIGFRNGNTKLVTINIPKGVHHGSQIRYPQMGDHSNPRYPAGDLIVRVNVRRHHTFKRQEDDLIIEQNINVYDVMLGTDISVTTLDRKTFTVSVPAGSQPDTVLRVTGEGLPNPHNGAKGNLLIKLKVRIPKKLSKHEIKTLSDLRNGKV